DVIETQTMASAVDGQGSDQVRLVELRGVERDYPYYGGIELEGGTPYSHDLLVGHGAVAQPELLIALGLKVGDHIRLPGQTFTITGAIAREKIQRGGIAFGPRIYVDLADLRTTSLLGYGSRASYQLYVRLADSAQAEVLTTTLRDALRRDFVG